ncbi:hypothetical protein [Pseudoalteromonas luteoviolacea]|uniref:Uncharacterized protein n=1 Tax=Pseudoalteromonas luteoviolacea NCIMB 1942 TaxID=1365253 RepID=A0A167G266_9GAMM|nr:hypothetical protein [Pseudoalteromonas luteoviolacea]KZN53965.1 hypothetical protein N482_24750 [Pseudoalteromonas luteoviolacea NCIMB 1942]KZX01389.1 hypothetical protein JL49_06005 [Pseudoalteromonas luteoviolacea]
MPRRIVKIKKRAAKKTSNDSNPIKLEPEDFDYGLTTVEVDDLNQFCNSSIQLNKEPEKELEVSLQDELELATEYDISTPEGFKDWLTLTATFGWCFIKQQAFSQFENQLQEPSSVDNEELLSRLLNQLAESI